MANHCVFCDTRRPEGGTKMLVVGTGPDTQWMEFCPECADTPVTNEGTGETITVGELFDRSEKESENART